MRYPHIAARVFDTPLLVTPAPLRAFLSVLAPKMGFEVRLPASGKQTAYAEPDPADVSGDGYRYGYVVEGGIARLPVYGPLVHRLISMEDICEGFTPYTGLTASFRAALADPGVNAIVLDVDSPGGEVSGCFDFADEIYEARGTKPITAVVNDQACSAAYLIASAADEVVATQTGWTGSVGVVWTHVDVSEANAMMGIAVTHVFAGDRKVDGTPFEPLSPEVKASIQASVNKTYALFVEKVARNRGMTAEAVIATQAEVYRGLDGVSIGFADRVSTLRETIEQLADLSRPSALTSGTIIGASMRSPEKKMAGQPTNQAGSESAIDAALREMQGRHELELATKTGLAEAAGKTLGAAEMKTRCKAILGSEEAKGRDAQAQHLAFETDMPVDQALGLLKLSPQTAAQTGNRLDAAMRAAGNPDVGPDGPAAGDLSEEDQAAAEAAKIVSTIRPRAA